MTTGFISDADFFLQFFELCIELDLKSEEDRLLLLTEMAKANEDRCSVFTTKRSKDQIAKDFSKNYGKVLHIKAEKD